MALRKTIAGLLIIMPLLAAAQDAESLQAERDLQVQRLLNEYRDARFYGMLDEADVLAKRIIELSIQLYGRDSKNTANALTNLGIVQTESGDHDAAILNVSTAIEIIEQLDDRLSNDLIEPLRALGAAQLRSARADQARISWNRAVHITQVNYGPHNYRQIEILNALGRMYFMADLHKDATKIRKRVYYLKTRNVNRKSEDMLPAIYEQARWLHDSGQYNKERDAYRSAIRIIEDNRGREDIALVDPLILLGRSHLFIDRTDKLHPAQRRVADGDDYLKRAVRIAFMNPETNWEIQHRALLELGHYHFARQEYAKADAAYERASKLASLHESVSRAASR